MKVLIIRFSSFGDILQGLSVPSLIHESNPSAEIHWVARSDFRELLDSHPKIKKVWSLDRRQGFRGLIRLAQELRRENFTHIYDAHNNLRSNILSRLLKSPHFIRRPKNRIKRLLLFRFRKNLFERPFIAQNSYLAPLAGWVSSVHIPEPPQLFLPSHAFHKVEGLLSGINGYITVAPSTAWPMKNWPVSHWKTLLQEFSKTPIVILGGPQDQECVELENELKRAKKPVYNLAGRLSLLESAAAIARSSLLISADTGLLHAADQLGVSSIALIGPTAFGYPARASTRVLEVDLDCKPCTKDGRGRCRNSVYQKCMVDITPNRVLKTIQEERLLPHL